MVVLVLFFIVGLLLFLLCVILLLYHVIFFAQGRSLIFAYKETRKKRNTPTERKNGIVSDDKDDRYTYTLSDSDFLACVN